MKSPINPGRVDRGWVVRVLRHDRNELLYPWSFVVISNDDFNGNPRDEVEVVKLERPFDPTPVPRSRVVPLFPYPPLLLAKLESALEDLLIQDAGDTVLNPCSVPGSVPELEFDPGPGLSYLMVPVVVLSRPLVWEVHRKVFFMDADRGAGDKYATDWMLRDPTPAGLSRGAFVRARLWSTDKDNIERWNKTRPGELAPPDRIGATRNLTDLLSLRHVV